MLTRNSRMWYTRYMDEHTGNGNDLPGGEGVPAVDNLPPGGENLNSGSEDWRSLLPEDLRESPALKDFTSVDKLAKSFVDTQAMVGNSIRIPGPDAGEDAWKEFNQKLVERVPGMYYMPEESADTEALFRKLGAPEKPEEYENPQLELPEGSELQELPGFREWAKEANLTKEQYKTLFARYTESQMQQAQEFEQKHKEGVRQLEAEWGATKEGKMKAMAAMAAKTGAPEDLIEAISQGSVGPETLRWLDGIVKAMGGEGSVIANQDGAGEGAITPAEANAQIEEIMARPEYWDSQSQLGAALRKKVVELQSMADPNATTDMNAFRAGFSG